MTRSESNRSPHSQLRAGPVQRARLWMKPVSLAWLFGAVGFVVVETGCSSANEPGSGSGGGTAGGLPGTGGSQSGGAGPGPAGSSSGGTPAMGGTASGGGLGAGMGGASAAGTGTAGAGTAGAGTAGAGTAGTGGAGARPTEYWIDPSGNDANPGTQAAPFKTPQHAISKVGGLGVTLWVNPGTYDVRAKITIQYAGTADRPARLWASPGARPVLDFAMQPRGDDNRGIQLRANYWHIRGLEVKNAGDSGIFVQGSYNTIENCVTHHNSDTGIQIMAENANLPGSNNTVLNCDSYANEDPDQEDADGFAAKEMIGPGNVFKGCRAWENVDDGWDFFAANQIVRVEDSWAFAQTGEGDGDGNGFKLGGEGGSAVHQVLRSYAFGNQAAGFTRNNNGSIPVLTSCGAWDNAEDYADLPATGNMDLGVSVAAAKAIMRNADGTLPPLR